MSEALYEITLTSGEVVKAGQWIRLVDKITPLFPRLKSNILPIRDYEFFSQEAYDFKFLQYITIDYWKIPVHKTLSLVEDKIMFFLKDEGTTYGYTQYFKIEIEPAIDHKEILLITKDEVCEGIEERKEPNVQKIIGDLDEAIINFQMGLTTKEEFESTKSNIFYFEFVVRKEWRREYVTQSYVFAEGTAGGWKL